MIDGKRIVVVTPAGRRRYLEVLSQHVLCDPNVDAWHLWANTQVPEDLEWMDAHAASNPRVRVIKPTWDFRHNFSIHKYFPTCDDPHAVYIRLDDDIVWCTKGAITKLAQRRLQTPSAFLVYGATVNNGLTSYVHQRRGLISTNHGITSYHCTDPIGWGSPQFAYELHQNFLNNHAGNTWELPDWWLINYERNSINVISWIGADGLSWVNTVGEDEEQWLACVQPQQLNRPNFIAGDCVFVHYAFYSQREVIDADPTILARYRELAGLAPQAA